MIVRILGEGQFSIGDAAATELTKLDADLETAVERNDGAAFTATLTSVLASVHAHGSPLPADSLEASDLILPNEDSSMDDVRRMLSDDGLITG